MFPNGSFGLEAGQRVELLRGRRHAVGQHRGVRRRRSQTSFPATRRGNIEKHENVRETVLLAVNTYEIKKIKRNLMTVRAY